MKEELNLAFSFSSGCDILTFTGTHIYVKGHGCIDEDNFFECILAIKKKLFMEMFEKFLQDKKRYYKSSNGSFCGIDSIYITDYKEIGTAYLNQFDTDKDVDDEGAVKQIDVKVYEVLDYESEMEHG